MKKLNISTGNWEYVNNGFFIDIKRKHTNVGTICSQILKLKNAIEKVNHVL